MFTKSLWNAFSVTTDFPSLKNNIEVDVAIIGGGITGLTTALELAKKGVKTAILEADKIGAGTTGYSTGNLYSTVAENLGMLRNKYDPQTLSEVIKARASAVDKIEQYVREYNIDCDFHRLPWYMYSATDENVSRIEKELKTSKEINLPVTTASHEEIPFQTSRAIKLENQAQFNPTLFVQELSKNIASKNCRIFENTKVTDVEEHGGVLKVLTNGITVEAKHVVHATHTPKGIKFVHTLLGPYREYGIACKIEANSHPEGIFWGYFEGEDKISTRTYHKNGEDYLIAVGKPHKTGQSENNVEHIKFLENFVHESFNVNEISYRWGGQHYRPADSLPYIGRDQKDSNIYIATGFSTDGLVYGTLAGSIIADLITNNSNGLSVLFDSTRNQPLKAAKEFVMENLNVAKQYIRNVPGVLDEGDFVDIAPGEGKVLEKDGEKIAVFKDDKGRIHACSAVCTHMACIVNWNNAEKTWDCPCHASRFSTEGEVLEGPAFNALKPLDFTQRKD